VDYGSAGWRRWRPGVLATVLGLTSPIALPGQQVQAILGATLIDGTGGPGLPDAVVVVRGDRIDCAGSRAACRVPAGAQRVEARGTWIIPGLIDAHVHFSQTGWFDGRPDAIDLRDRYPYPEVIAGLEANPQRFFRSYLCAGVTSVFDVGGYPWTWALRRRFADSPDAPRIAAAGPLLSTVDHWLNLPSEKQFIYMANDSVVRLAVRTHAAFRSDALKIWYLMPPQPPDTARIQALVRVAADEAHAHGLRVIVHATGLREAKDAIRAGAQVLVHSVFEDPVDDELVSLARAHAIVFVPTITVYEGYEEAAFRGVSGSRYPLDCLDSVSAGFARSGPVPADRVPAGFRERAAQEKLQREIHNALANAGRLQAAGMTIALGTDAGNPGTFHGPSIYREMALLEEAGLSPLEVLVAATRNSARAMGWEDRVGTLEAGKAADLVVLDADPVTDLRNVQRIRWVMKAGAQVYPTADSGTGGGAHR